MRQSDIGRLMLGEESVWQKFVEEFHRLVVWIIRQRGVPESDVDDVAQAAWMKAYERRGTFRAGKVKNDASAHSLLKAWISVIAFSCAMDFFRRRGREESPCSSEDIERLSGVEEVQHDLWDLLQGFEKKDRDLLRMRMETYTFKEIAERTGTSQTSAYRRFMRIAEQVVNGA